MYIYIDVYVHICVYASVHVDVNMYVFMHMYIHKRFTRQLHGWVLQHLFGSCTNPGPRGESRAGATPGIRDFPDQRVQTSTPQLPLKTPQIPANRDHMSLIRGTLGV